MCPMNACRPPFTWPIRVPDGGDGDARPEARLGCVLIGGPVVRVLIGGPVVRVLIGGPVVRVLMTAWPGVAMTCSHPCLTQRVAR